MIGRKLWCSPENMNVKKADIDKLGRQISEKDLKDGEYVVLVYETHPIWRKVRFAYRNFVEFKKKVEKDLRKMDMDEDNGVYFEWREFD